MSDTPFTDKLSWNASKNVPVIHAQLIRPTQRQVGPVPLAVKPSDFIQQLEFTNYDQQRLAFTRALC